MHPTSRSLAALFAYLCAPLAGAQSLFLEFEPSASALDLSMNVELSMPGTLIGDYDAQANPGGTRTLPGLFGGGTNEAIPLDAALRVVGALDEEPSGSLRLDADTAQGLVQVTELGFTLAAVPGAAALELDLSYDTFRSFAPDSLFLGGIPLTLPLGAVDLTGFAFVQTGVGAGTLTALGGGQWQLAAVALGELSFEVSLNGQATPVGPIPASLPLNGVLDLSVSPARLDSSALFSDATNQPTTGLVISDQPFALPTILPPGGTANLLYDGEITQIASTTDLDLSLVALEATDCSAQSFCSSSANSTGFGATIATNGQHSVSANVLELVAGPVPNDSGLFFYSAAQAAGGAGVPFGNGLRCIGAAGSPIVRLPVIVASGGEFRYTPDLSAPPTLPGTITAGSTWHFQCWFRDPAGGGAFFDLSDAITVHFCQ